MNLKPEKSSALKIAQQLSPLCVELLRDIQKDGGRISFSPEVSYIQNIVGSYVGNPPNKKHEIEVEFSQLRNEGVSHEEITVFRQCHHGHIKTG